MRRCVLLACFAAVVSPAFAAKRLTVEQLEQVLSAIHSKPDAEIARQLSDLQLTERLSTARASPDSRRDLPGPEARQALTALADLSAFLGLPPAEIPATAAPDFAEQRRVMALTVEIRCSQTLHQLPNFSATRITTRFQDQPEGYEKGGSSFVPAQPLARAGTASATVFYRDGGEVVNASAKSKKGEPIHGLSTSGEFGPILAITLLDAAHSKLAWGHWEQGGTGPVAVFDYSVPSERSHYEVSYCCFVEGLGADPSDFRPFVRSPDTTARSPSILQMGSSSG